MGRRIKECKNLIWQGSDTSGIVIGVLQCIGRSEQIQVQDTWPRLRGIININILYDPFPRVLPSIVLADEALCSTKADLILLQVPGVQLPNTLQVKIA